MRALEAGPAGGVGRGLASLCAVCHGWGRRRRVCEACLGRFAAPVARCSRCAIEVDAAIEVCGACLAAPPPYRQAVAAVSYEYPWDRLVAAFKFHAALDLAPAFADLMQRARQAAAGPVPTLLLPVPLSGARLRERGYNQAWELARRLGRDCRCSADSALLLRIRDTPHQLALPPGRRAANVRGAFALEPRRAAEIRGRHVALVDDVMTTGATAAEAAGVLLRAGAERVDVWVFARTPQPRDAA
jgi:ComF family protein